MAKEAALANLLEREALSSGAGGCRVVPYRCCREIACALGLSALDVEIKALGLGFCPSRYERNIGTLGIDGQKKLLESCVAVVGAGGLGGLVAEMLARIGVGRLVLIDGDSFCENNLNRQILCTEADIGRMKAELAGDRVRAINGALEVRAVEAYLDEDNVSACIGGADLVIDALDNNRARAIVSRFCRERRIPFVHGAIGGLWAQAGIFMPDDAMPWEVMQESPDRGLELVAGNLPFTAAFASSAEVALAVRFLTGIGSVRNGVLHWFDLADLSVQHIGI